MARPLPQKPANSPFFDYRPPTFIPAKESLCMLMHKGGQTLLIKANFWSANAEMGTIFYATHGKTLIPLIFLLWCIQGTIIGFKHPPFPPIFDSFIGKSNFAVIHLLEKKAEFNSTKYTLSYSSLVPALQCLAKMTFCWCLYHCSQK